MSPCQRSGHVYASNGGQGGDKVPPSQHLGKVARFHMNVSVFDCPPKLSENSVCVQRKWLTTGDPIC